MSKARRPAGLVAELPAWQGTDGDENISAGKKVLNEPLRFFLIFHRGENRSTFQFLGRSSCLELSPQKIMLSSTHQLDLEFPECVSVCECARDRKGRKGERN